MDTDGERRLPEDLERFEFEDEESFGLALEVAELADSLAMDLRRDRPWAASQLGRCGLSVLNNTAEARGEYSPGDKARFFRYARRSATETAAMIILLARKGLITRSVEIRARQILLTLIKLLTRRSIHFQRQASARRAEAARGWRSRKGRSSGK